MDIALTPEDARLLYALLDAAEDDGLMAGFAEAGRWRDVKRRAATVRFQQEGRLFWTLLSALERTGKLDSTWILARWISVKNRVQRTY